MDDRLPWLRLCCAQGVGAVGQRKLLQAFGSPDAVFSASSHALGAVLGARADALLAAETLARAEEVLRWLDQPGRALVTLADSDYPQGLLQLADPPPSFFLIGQREVLARRFLAIVGSRAATTGGEATATLIGACFAVSPNLLRQ